MSIFDEKTKAKRETRGKNSTDFERVYHAWQDEPDKKTAWRISITLNTLWKSMSEDQRQMAVSILPENIQEAIKIFDGKVVKFG